MLRIGLLAFLALPSPALAYRHCNYYHYSTVLPAPFIALESDLVLSNNKEKVLLAEETICTEMRIAGHVPFTVPGSRHVRWNFSVSDGKVQVEPRPPFGTFFVKPKDCG